MVLTFTLDVMPRVGCQTKPLDPQPCDPLEAMQWTMSVAAEGQIILVPTLRPPIPAAAQRDATTGVDTRDSRRITPEARIMEVWTSGRRVVRRGRLDGQREEWNDQRHDGRPHWTRDATGRCQQCHRPSSVRGQEPHAPAHVTRRQIPTKRLSPCHVTPHHNAD